MNKFVANNQSYPFDRLSGVKDITIKGKCHNFFKQIDVVEISGFELGLI